MVCSLWCPAGGTIKCDIHLLYPHHKMSFNGHFKAHEQSFKHLLSINYEIDYSS